MTAEFFWEITCLYACNANAVCTCGVLHSMTESGGPKSQLPAVAV